MNTLIQSGSVRINTESGALYLLEPKRRISGGSLNVAGVICDRNIHTGMPMFIIRLEDGHMITTTNVAIIEEK
mgnify:CR=1 FL=1